VINRPASTTESTAATAVQAFSSAASTKTEYTPARRRWTSRACVPSTRHTATNAGHVGCRSALRLA